MNKRAKIFGFIAVLLVTGFVYYLTLAPTVYWIDSAIYLSAVKEFGIAYPPGFPLYIIVAKLWSFLPLPGMNFTQKINFLSSVFASLTCGVLYLTVLKLFENGFSFLRASLSSRPASGRGGISVQDNSPDRDSSPRGLGMTIAFLVAIAFGFSHSLWYSAGYAEVYTLNAFLYALTLYFIISYGTTFDPAKQKKYFLGAVISYGLSYANHPMTIGLIPAAIWLLWKIRKERGFRIKSGMTVALTLIFFLCGFLPYLYIPFRAAQNPNMNWGNPSTLGNFINHVTGRHWTGDTANFVFFNQKFYENIISWLSLSYHQFFLVGVALSLVGFFYLWKKKKQLFRLLLLAAGGAIFWAVFYVTGEFESWLIPAHYVGAIFMAAGAWWLLAKERRAATTVAIALLLLSIVSSLAYNWRTLDRSGDYLAEEPGRDILRNVDNGSILISEAGMALSSIIYNQYVLGDKPDVISFHRNSLWAPWMRQNLKKYADRGLVLPAIDISAADLGDKAKQDEFNNKYLEAFIKANLDKFKIYTVLPDNFDGLQITPWGYGYIYSWASSTPPVPDIKLWNFAFKNSRFCSARWPSVKDFSLLNYDYFGMNLNNGAGFRHPEDIQVESNKEFNEIRAGYAASYGNLAKILLQRHEFKKTIFYSERAINLLNDNFSDDQKYDMYLQKALALFYDKQYEKAISFAYGIDDRYPKKVDTAWILGAAYNKLGEQKKASQILLEAIRLYPKDENLNALFNKIISETQKK